MYEQTHPNLPQGWPVEIGEEDFSREEERGEGSGSPPSEAPLSERFIAFIYALVDPITGLVRYVGKTINPPQRLQYHLYTDKRGRKANWIKSLLSQGLKPRMEILEEIECSCDEDWHESESFWICYMRFLGFDLTNLESGGQGPGRIALETRLKMSEAKKGKPGRPMTPEHKAILLQCRLGSEHTEETKKKISETNKKTGAIERLKGYTAPAGWNKGIPHSEETKAKQSATHKAIGTGKYPKSQEHRDKISKTLTGRKMTEEERAKLRGPRGPNIRTLRKLGLVAA